MDHCVPCGGRGMKVCIAHGGDLSIPSGGTNRVSGVAGALADRDENDVTIVAPRPADALSDRFDRVEFVPVDVGTRGIVDQPTRALRVSRRARRIASERNGRLQIEHSTLAGVGSLVGCSGYVLDMLDLAFQSPQYGDLPLGGVVQRVLRRLEGRGLRAADAIVVVSESMRELVTAEWGIPRDRMTVIPNGYHPDVVAPYVGAEEVEGRVAFLGTLHRKLDLDAFRAIARLDAVSDFVVIGNGGLRADLETMARREPALRVTGRIPDAEAFPQVASAQVVVNPQRRSDLQVASSPVKLYYYAALERPMVLTRGPDAAAWLEAEGAARLVEPGGDVAGAVADLLDAPAVRQRMGTRGGAVCEAATWDRRGAALADVYAQ